MKHVIYLFLLFSISSSFGQIRRIQFTYDGAGNQIKREICSNCAAKNAKDSDYKNVETVTEKDLIEEDVNISYYPNPVREELYVKWKIETEKTVKTIEVYSMTGQMLKSYNNLETSDITSISFQTYPQGLYNVKVLYSNGDNKTLKIVKK
jgi:Secretion system C-terminal sorting domain